MPYKVQPEAFGQSRWPSPSFTGVIGSSSWGSSIISRASFQLPLLYNRLVTVAFIKMRKLTLGISCPKGVGVPPEHNSRTSPTNSAIPSDRTSGASPACGTHDRGCGEPICALPTAAIIATMASSSKLLRKVTISFSLWNLKILN
jgi:hypothetical protein